ncbi:MAG: nucleotidyltransferase substrate binding protein [Sphingobacteriaceae bacterium]|nr:nucleotidyltransferase substrate binding protein [Sphingobacteriaceae bacterium]
MEDQDIRWVQRFSNYQKALLQLKKFIDKGELNELEEQGIIQSFEYTYELAWNVIKDYYHNQGVISIQGSRDAFRLAFNRELISDGEIWMKMIDSRIKSSHTYNEEVAAEISEAIFNYYYDAFLELELKFKELKRSAGML